MAEASSDAGTRQPSSVGFLRLGLFDEQFLEFFDLRIALPQQFFELRNRNAQKLRDFQISTKISS